MVSVAIGGYLIEAYGYTVVLNISVGLYLLSSLAYYLFFGKSEHRHAERPNWHIPGKDQV
jgi:predicted MFS family arabinose efflux permease